jgi:dipeptidase E
MKVDEADVIIASGGNTIFAIDRFVNSGFRPILENAMAQGKIFCGGSFGALWVFDAGHSDSMDPDTYKGAMTGTLAKGGDESTNLEGEAKPWEYVRVPALGFLPGLCAPHYDKV